MKLLLRVINPKSNHECLGTYFGMLVSSNLMLFSPEPVILLSRRFRLQLGPFRYIIAELLKFLSLPQYRFEVDYLSLSPQRNPKLKSPKKNFHDQLSECSKVKRSTRMDGNTRNNWVMRKGEFLGILFCNRSCNLPRGYFLRLLHQNSSKMMAIWTCFLSMEVKDSDYFALLLNPFCGHLLLLFVGYVKVD